MSGTSWIEKGVAVTQTLQRICANLPDRNFCNDPKIREDVGELLAGECHFSSRFLDIAILNNNLGEFSFLLNGGFALLSAAFACFAIAKRRPEPNHGLTASLSPALQSCVSGPQRSWRLRWRRRACA